MSPALHAHRALTASRRNVPLVARKTRRARGGSCMIRTATTLSYPLEEEQSTFDIQIFDIFDAPSRLGESSKLLSRTASPRAPSSAPSRSKDTFPPHKNTSPTIKTLPAPILYDGPARPRHVAHIAYRVGRAASTSSTVHERSSDHPFTLPPPIVFDGPSRLRPYNRNTTANASSKSPSSSRLALLLAASGAFALAGYKYHDEQDLPRKYGSPDK